MSVAIVLATVSLVLVGMLFGFNIQVNNTFLAALSSVGTLLAGLAAAAAAYFSYASIGQWKKQAEHSLLYEQIDELESLLITFVNNVKCKAFDSEYNGVRKVLGLTATCAKEIRPEYERLFNKIYDLTSEDKHSYLEVINLDSLIKELYEPILELKSSNNRMDKFIELNEDTKTKPMHEFPELMEEMHKHFAYQLAITTTCEGALDAIRNLRKSL